MGDDDSVGRDPRINPKPGDSILSFGTCYTVTSAGEAGVEYLWHDDDDSGSGALHLTSWRREFEHAIVLEVSP